MPIDGDTDCDPTGVTTPMPSSMEAPEVCALLHDSVADCPEVIAVGETDMVQDGEVPPPPVVTSIGTVQRTVPPSPVAVSV